MSHPRRLISIAAAGALAGTTLFAGEALAITEILIPTQDSYIESASPTNRNGDKNEVLVKIDSSSRMNALFLFDLSNLNGGILQGVTVTNATLRLWEHAGSGRTYGVFSSTSTSWNDSTSSSGANPGVNWNNFGGNQNGDQPTALATVTTASNTFRRWNSTALTTHIQSIVNGTGRTTLIVRDINTGSAEGKFRTKEYADSSKSPANCIPVGNDTTDAESGSTRCQKPILIVEYTYTPPVVIVDTDGDGVPDDEDNCPNTPNPGQADADGDKIGDACEADTDEDEVIDDIDNCPLVYNPDQTDTDGDRQGDACEPDTDLDGVIDHLDNCPSVANPDQNNADDDGVGDACDPDSDNDGVDDDVDNCPLVPNPSQADSDEDGAGNECDADNDGDGVNDANDQCLGTPSGQVADANGCAISQLCPCENEWKNHGVYQRCVAHAAESFLYEGLITKSEKDAIVSQAAKSSCGQKK